MKKRKLLAGLLAFAMVGTLISGCGRSSAGGDQSATETPAGEGTTAEATAEATPTVEDVPATPTPTLEPVAPETQEKSNHIYVILPETDEGASAQEAAIIQAKAQEYGYTVVLCEHDGELDKQTEFFAQAIRENAMGIICDNADVSVTIEAVQMAKDAGIPTVLINKGIDAEEVAISQIITNSVSGAGQVATAFLEQFPNGGSYVELLGSSENMNAFDATNAFHSVADANYDVFVERQEIGNEYSEDDAEAKIRQMLTDSPESTGIVCYNGLMADAAVDVVEDMGKSGMTIVCLSADEDAEEMVREHELFAAVIKPAELLATMSIDQLHKYLTEGNTGVPDEVQYVDGTVIRADQV